MKCIKVATLCATYNRKEVTLQCVEKIIASSCVDNINFTHYIVDDNSTDGTKQALLAQFPSITLLQGNGALYWAGAMRLGWNHLKPHDYDFLMVYNDDIMLFDDSIQILFANILTDANIKTLPIAYVASFQDQINSQLTYGGFKLNWNGFKPTFKLLYPSANTILQADSLNMNLAVINKVALLHTNFLSPYYKHHMADLEFGLRINKIGGAVKLSPGFSGYCSRHDEERLQKLSNLGILEYFHFILSPKGYPVSQSLHFYFSHFSILIAIISIFRLYINKYFLRSLTITILRTVCR